MTIRLTVAKGVTPNGLSFWESKNVLKLDCILIIAQLCNYLKMIKLLSFNVLMLLIYILTKLLKVNTKKCTYAYSLKDQ